MHACPHAHPHLPVRQELFAPLRAHPLLADLVENVDVVLGHFGGRLRKLVDEDAAADAGTVLEHIRVAARDWRPGTLRQMADLKFTYEQEARPEDFFTPHLWGHVFSASGLAWRTERLVLIPPPNAEGPDGGGDGGWVSPQGTYGNATSPLPVLSELPVDEEAVGPRRLALGAEAL